MAGEVFRSTFTANELITADTTTVAAGVITRLGSYKVQAGEQISIGYGQLAGMDNATGRIFMSLFDGTSGTHLEITGSIRLEAYSAQNRPIEILNEWRTEDLNTSATDKTKQLPLPEHAVWLREDQMLVLNLIPDSVGNGSLVKANSKILLAMTKMVL